jgi:hypothetical protein
MFVALTCLYVSSGKYKQTEAFIKGLSVFHANYSALGG